MLTCVAALFGLWWVSVSCALMISAAADLHPELPFSTPAWLRGGGPCARRWLPWSSLGIMVWKTPLHVLGVQTTLAPKVLWAKVLGFLLSIFGLHVGEIVSPAIVLACIRAWVLISFL